MFDIVALEQKVNLKELSVGLHCTICRKLSQVIVQCDPSLNNVLRQENKHQQTDSQCLATNLIKQ